MRGETLIEALVALGIITVVVTALVGVIVTSMGNTRFSEDQNLARQYAQEGMEIVRQTRDNDYAAFRSLTGDYCLASLPSVLTQPCSTGKNVDSFFRKVTIIQAGCSADVANVAVTVSWQDSKCPAANTFCHASRLESCLSSVNPVPPL